MRKKILWFVLGLGILGLGAAVFFTFFEVVEDESYVLPSREVQINDYLALDRWLRAEGYGVRVENTGNVGTIKAAREKTILIQTDLFDWDETAPEYLAAWADQGGSLILCLNDYRSLGPGGFLEALGLEIEDGSGVSTYSYASGGEFPSYSRSVRFREPGDKSVRVFRDESGAIRLARFSQGKGDISVLGRPRFMTSGNLGSEANARLSWFLLTGENSGPTAENPGILFIRGERPARGILGRIFQRGNLWGIIISALVLIAAGFWSAIPVFGVVKETGENPGKALAERFLAEGRFLNRYKALDGYRAAYFREIRRRLVKREERKDEEIIRRAAALLGSGATDGGLGEVERATAPGPQRKKDFIHSIVTLKTILERL